MELHFAVLRLIKSNTLRALFESDINMVFNTYRKSETDIKIF